MTDRSSSHRQTHFSLPGAWLLVAGAAGGLVASLVYCFWRGDGIAYTKGVYLVIASSGIILAAALVMALDTRRPWLTSAFLNVSTLIGILGTGFAAWLLEANWLLALMGLSAVGWLVHVIFDDRAAPVAARGQPHLQESHQ